MNTAVFLELEDVGTRVQIPNVDGILLQRGGHDNFLKHGEERIQSTAPAVCNKQETTTYSYLLQFHP